MGLAGSITARAEAFGIETARSDTWHWRDLFVDMGRSVDAVRASGRPRFHLVDTYRLMAHSKGDDNRPADLVATYRERDPLTRLSAQYESDSRFQTMLARLTRMIEQAVEEAEKAPFAPLDVASPLRSTDAQSWEPLAFEEERVVDSVRRGLSEGLGARKECC